MRWDLSGSSPRAWQRRPTRLKPARYARKWWYHISSEVFYGRAPNLRRRVIHRRIQPMSSFSFFLMHNIRKEAPSLQIEAGTSKIERTGNQIARSSWSKNSTCYPRGGTMSLHLMCRNRYFTATNATYRLDFQRTRACPSFSSCPLSFSFLHLMNRREESMEDRPRKKL